jgi:hypothetical protein
MSTETLYKQKRDKLYSWLNEVFGTPNKIVGIISWNSRCSECMLFVDESSHRITNIEMGKYAEKELDEIKLRILRQYATNPGISDIRLDKLTDEEKYVLKEEVKRHYKPLKKEITPYEVLLIKLQHPVPSPIILWVYNKLKG